MRGGGSHGLAAGFWTDDTSMALCLAESLIECGGFDAGDQMHRYVRWLDEGYWSSTGECFDIGMTTRASLSRFKDDADTTAAVCGQIAGAFYGAAAIPEEWRSQLHRGDEVEGIGARLLGT